MKTKFAIGCLVQWYECNMIGEYVDSLKDALDVYDGQVIIDFTVVCNEDLEQCISVDQKDECLHKITEVVDAVGGNVKFIDDLHTIADYRREFNINYCDQVDVLIWGESDALLPKQIFVVQDSLHQQVCKETPKYLSFFATCKMWDDSWKPIEHVDLTNKERDTLAWYGSSYVMSKHEMNNINDKVEELDVRVVSPHKFNGCGLIISSEVVKAGVNIPKSVFFTHEDTAFQHMTNKVLGNIPQYIIKNILLVHNRQHPNKRSYVKNEEGPTIKDRRMSNKWYEVAGKMSEHNAYNLFNNVKSYSWEDVWNQIN